MISRENPGICENMDLSNIYVNAQSSIKIVGEKTIYFDPYKITEETHDADIVFITHAHPDHFQPESISKVKNDSTIIVAPMSMEKQVKDAFGTSHMELWEPGTSHRLDKLEIDTIPAYNGAMKPFHTKGKRWQGYLVTMDGIRYYIAGDTDANNDIKQVQCDVAIIPIGGMFTMDKHQAADYILELIPRAVIPTHYGDIVGSPEDGNDFKNQIENANKNILVEIKLQK